MCNFKKLKEIKKPGKKFEKTNGNPRLSLIFRHQLYFFFYKVV